MGDRMLLEGLQFFGYHGVHDSERLLGQRFVVDVALSLSLRLAGEHDDMSFTVDYGAVYRVVRDVVEGERRQLIEAVAEATTKALLDRFPIEEVWVRVTKPSAPIAGAVFSRVAVEVTRRRRDSHVAAT